MMFMEAKAFNQDISGWDVSSVTDIQVRHYYTMPPRAPSLDRSLAGTLQHVLTFWTRVALARVLLQDMFSNAKAFNQDVSGWDVSAVTSSQVRHSTPCPLARHRSLDRLLAHLAAWWCRLLTCWMRFALARVSLQNFDYSAIAFKTAYKPTFS